MEWHRRLNPDPADLTWWVAWLFMVGSVLFALGSFPAYSQLVDPGVVGTTFVVGSIFFTSAAAGQLWQAIRPSDAPGRAFTIVGVSVSVALVAAVVQLVGTLLFNLNTIRAMIDGLSAQETNRLVWAPDFFGSIAFLVASHLGWRDVSKRTQGSDESSSDRVSAGANYVGSGLFMLAALASFTLPTTGDVVNIAIVNSATCLGAFCFLAGSYLLLPPADRARRSVDDSRE